MMDKLKAIVAAIVGAALFWIKTKFNIDLGAEVEATIVGLVMGLLVYIVPNSQPADTKT